MDDAAANGDVLDSLSLPWVLGGSLAGSLYGEPRSTNDVDVAVGLGPEDVPQLIDAVGDRDYVPAQALADPARHHDSANLLELSTGFKIDLLFRGEHEAASAAEVLTLLERLLADADAEVARTSCRYDALVRPLPWALREARWGRFPAERSMITRTDLVCHPPHQIADRLRSLWWAGEPARARPGSDGMAHGRRAPSGAQRRGT